MNKNLHFWTVKHWMNRPGMNYNGFTIWASPKFVEAAKKAMGEMDEERVQAHARAMVCESDRRGEHHHWLTFRPEVGLAHIDVPGNACGLDLDFKSEEIYEKAGFTLLPHNIDTAEQQSTIFAIWVWWAQCVETYVDDAEEGEGCRC